MTSSITPDLCLQKLQRLCATAEHCEHELREKMFRWGLPPEDADAVIASLRKDRFIDDERFARAYTLDKLRYNHWGRIKIRMMLHSLRLPESAIEYGLGEIDEKEYADIRQHLIEKKNKEIKDKDEYVRRAKLQRFLYSRGFSSGED